MKFFVVTVLILVFVFGSAFYVNNSLYSLEKEKEKLAVLSVLGIGELSLSSECVSILEGITSCLGEVPGGYCYHSDCDILEAPDFNVDNRFEMVLIKPSIDSK